MMDLSSILKQYKTDDRKEAFIRASWDGNLDAVKYIMEGGYIDDVKTFIYENDVYTYKDGPFKVACWRGNFDVAKYFIENSVIDAEHCDKLELPFRAVRWNLYGVRRYLIKTGVKIDRPTSINTSNMMKKFKIASYEGRFKLLKYIVEKYNIDVAGKPYSDMLFMYAAGGGCVDLMKYLVERGADKYLHDRDDYVMEMAISGGDLNVVKYLASIGGNLLGYDGKVNDRLDTASGYGHEEIVKYLLEQGYILHHQHENATYYAVMNCRVDILKLLLPYGASIHYGGDYAVRVAVQIGEFDNADELISLGADITNCGDNLFWIVARDGKLDAVKYLIEKHGFDFHLKDNKALEDAIKNKHDDVVKYLVEKGADISKINNKCNKDSKDSNVWGYMRNGNAWVA